MDPKPEGHGILLEILEQLCIHYRPELLCSSNTHLILIPYAFNRCACYCLGRLIGHLEDTTFTKFWQQDISAVDSVPFLQILTSFAHTDEFLRTSPFLDSIILSRIEKSLSTDDVTELVPALLCTKDILLLRSTLNGSLKLSLAQITRLLPHIKRSLTFGLSSSHNIQPLNPSDDYDSDYYDEEGEDSSWEVRLAAVKVSSAAISVSIEACSNVWTQLSADPSSGGSGHDISNMLQHELNPILIELLANKETDLSVLGELMEHLASVPSTLPSTESLTRAISNRKHFFESKPKLRSLIQSVHERLSREPNQVEIGKLRIESRDLETIHSNVNLFEATSITMIDAETVQLLSFLLSQIQVDESCFKVIDLGAFKHREDSLAPSRKLALSSIDIFFRKCDPKTTMFEETNPICVLEIGTETIIKSLNTVDMTANMAEDFFGLILSLMKSIEKLNPSVLVAIVPKLIERISSIVSSCPVGKREGLNHGGMVLGRFVTAVIDLVRLEAKDEGTKLKSLVDRKYPLLQGLIEVMKKETTEGSIIRTAYETIGPDVVLEITK